jgi:hypothetical protein
MLANFEPLRICLLKMNSRRHFRAGARTLLDIRALARFSLTIVN